MARSLFQQLLWWRPHVGVPFPLFDPFVASWNCLPEGSVSAQQGPLKVPDVFALCRLAASSQASLAAFCGFALMPLVSLLHFAHLQCSVSFRVEGPLLWATCVRGKSKIQESRPPFQWACPVSFLGFTNVFEQAINVHRDLISACPSAAFVIPDISVPEQCLQEPCTWTRGKMSLPKFLRLLRDVLRRLGSATSDVHSVCRYSLRRFLPTLAEVSRCPESLALHVGNWVESVALKHVPARQKGVCQRYAGDKVATAAGSKSKLLQLLHLAAKQKAHAA